MTSRTINVAMAIMKLAIVVAVIAWIANVPSRLGIALFTEQMLAAVLGFSLALTFLMYPLSGRHSGEEAVAMSVLEKDKQAQAGWIDILLAVLALAACLYVAVRYQSLIRELVYRPWDGILVATVIVLAVLEATRRVTGWALVIIVLLLCAHAMLGWMLPEQFASRPVHLSRLLVYLGIDTNSLLGNTLQIAIIVVVPFIIFGQVLNRCGGSEFFGDLAAAIMGRFRGGSAKIAVFGSALFGMISGSAVANVASVGTVTIPLMKRSGFPPHTAGAIEAVGSTGGQIAPPVMGAAAFLMAEYLQVSYASVMVAAIIPAFLYYAALFAQVDLESAKLGIQGTPRDEIPSLGRVLIEGWHFVVPFAVLIAGLVWWNLEAEYAALYATAAMIALALVVPHKGKRLGFRQIGNAFVAAGGSVVEIIAVTAVSGLLIGVLALTGVAFALTQQLLLASGGNLTILLILTAFVSFVLGLPLPTLGVYVILATLAAPALVQAGLLPMQAHMFVLFSGMLGMVTPPVALSAFAAAAIAKADQWRTGWTATRIGWCAYFIPFMFAFSPELIMEGSPLRILLVLALVCLGIFMGSVAVVGYLTAPVPAAFRIAYGAIALMLLYPPGAFASAIYINFAGAVFAALAISRELARGRQREKRPA